MIPSQGSEQMLNYFKRREWKPQTMPELKGACNGLYVTLHNFPCLIDASDGKRKYAYANFGPEFLAELTDRQLSDFEHVRQVLSAGAGMTVQVRLRELGAIEVQVSGHVSARRGQFYCDLADALIAAFEAHGIKP
jgi:hypothetical protein